MSSLISRRFRKFLPVVVDVETSGFDARQHALLEIAAVLLNFNQQNQLIPVQTLHFHVQPFLGAKIDSASLKINGIDPFHPLRLAIPEEQLIKRFFDPIKQYQLENDCNRCILVGHNASFDLAFINELNKRIKYVDNPFHNFSVLDTVSFGALAFGQTVLARIAQAAGINYDHNQAHGARYDTELTAEIFCRIFNQWSCKIGFNF